MKLVSHKKKILLREEMCSYIGIHSGRWRSKMRCSHENTIEIHYRKNSHYNENDKVIGISEMLQRIVSFIPEGYMKFPFLVEKGLLFFLSHFVPEDGSHTPLISLFLSFSFQVDLFLSYISIRNNKHQL